MKEIATIYILCILIFSCSKDKNIEKSSIPNLEGKYLGVTYSQWDFFDTNLNKMLRIYDTIQNDTVNFDSSIMEFDIEKINADSLYGFCPVCANTRMPKYFSYKISTKRLFFYSGQISQYFNIMTPMNIEKRQYLSKLD